MVFYFLNILFKSSIGYSTATVGVFTFFYKLILSFFEAIETVIVTNSNDVAGIFGGGISQIFDNYANSMLGLGIWAPLVMIVSIGIAGGIIYIILDMAGSVRAID